MFNYSGNKQKISPLLKAPLGDIVIEPFAGSARYSLFYQPPKSILFEKNQDIYDLWAWLIDEATEQDLSYLERQKVTTKIDIRTLGFPKPMETLFRLTCASVYTGQLSSWIAYPQNAVNYTKLKSVLPYIKESVTLGGRNFQDSLDLKGTFFVDPPYLKTSGNYKDKSNRKSLDSLVTADEIELFIDKLESPVIFTYGSDAEQVFPRYDWKIVTEKKVPKIRTGGTVIRRDYVYYKNYAYSKDQANYIFK